MQAIDVAAAKKAFEEYDIDGDGQISMNGQYVHGDGLKLLY